MKKRKSKRKGNEQGWKLNKERGNETYRNIEK